MSSLIRLYLGMFIATDTCYRQYERPLGARLDKRTPRLFPVIDRFPKISYLLGLLRYGVVMLIHTVVCDMLVQHNSELYIISIVTVQLSKK